MKYIYVTATDIDFSSAIGEAFRILVANPDFHSALIEDKKAAICHLANGLSIANSVMRGWMYRDHTKYLLQTVKVSDTDPTEDYLDVGYLYCPHTKQVY